MSKKILSLIGTVLSTQAVGANTLMLLVSFVICPMLAWGETIEVALPDLVGELPIGDAFVKVEHLDLGRRIGRVVKASIKLRGRFLTGTYRLNEQEWVLYGTVKVSLPEPENGSWVASKEFDISVDFDVEIEFEWYGWGEEPSWNFLEDGEAQVKAYLSVSVNTYMENVHKPSINIWEARLIIETVPPDTDPPDPDPMTWAKVPDQTGTTSITMAATQATDETPPISYYFLYYSSPTLGRGGTSSGWQSSTSYTNSGLSANHQYTYKVMAKDGASPGNEGSYSSYSSEYTAANVPGTGSFSEITNSSIRVTWTHNENPSHTEYLCQNSTNNRTSGWIRGTSWTNTELIPNTTYPYRVKARNGDGLDTDWIELSSATTDISISVTSPNDGESWQRGTSQNITWDYSDDAGSAVTIELYKGGSPNLTIIDSTSNHGSYSWFIPANQTIDSDYKIKITSTSNSSYYDYSDNNFSITGEPPIITVTEPNGGESWRAGTFHNITWTVNDRVGARVKIHLYKNDNFNDIIKSSTSSSTDSSSTDGSYRWHVPLTLTSDSDYKIRIMPTSNTDIFDESDDYFSIDGNDGTVVVFEDIFPSTTIDQNKWTVVDGAKVEGVGKNMPSPEYSLRLNGDPNGGDLVESKVIDLSSYSDATLVYYYQQTGGGDPPREGEDLIVDYYDGSSWIELVRHPGDGTEMMSYELRTITLPLEALHTNFKLRIKRGEGPPGPYGDWFVDDVRIEVTGDNIVYPVKLIASDGKPDDWFGRRISISGKYAIAGALNNDDYRGSAYIFERSSTGWIQQPKLTASSPSRGDYFGCDVSISGDYAIVGTYGEDCNGTDSGSAYIFKGTDQGWIMDTAGVHPLDGVDHDRFGCAVSISGDYSIIGSYWEDDNGTDSGSAYVLQRTGTSWLGQTYKLGASDAAKYDWFGCSVSISGDYALVGASLHDDSVCDCGTAYIFKRDSTGWTQKANLLALDREAGDEFGGSVSLSGNYAVVGAICDDEVVEDSGAAYIFERSGEYWIQRAKLTPSDDEASGDHFGDSVSIDGDYVVVGATLDDDMGEDSGAAYIFKREGLSWELQTKLTASDGNEGDHFGQGVSISGTYVIVGAPNDNVSGDNSGSVYIFKRNGTKWMP